MFDLIAPKLKAYYRKGGIEAGLAEDLVQDVMLTVWRHASRFSPALGSPSTWIFTIARNRLIDHVRREKVRQGDLNDPTLQPAPAEDAVDLIDRRQRYSSLKAAIATLPEDQAEMLNMAFFEHKAHSEIAEESGLPLGTVKSRIRLAVGRLRSALGACS
ncbi:MAG: sigma-70 family RNA polymerase sigma factor [Geminicoccaceae bacterium]